MSKWIDADEVAKLMKCGCAYVIWELPSIDIVKCGECKHRYADTEQRGCIKNPTQFWKADDYCSYGERRE